MTLIAGIDPGNNGAVAVYDPHARQLVSVEDLPFWFQTVGKKKRRRLDPIGLMELFDTLAMIGVELAVMEAVGGRPRQSASAGFAFGYTVGLIYANLMRVGVMVETVPPMRWKKMMNVPGKQGGSQDRKLIKKAEGDIINRSNELFPQNTDMFKTERGAIRMDRIDAAFLAKFGGDHVLRTIGMVTDVEFKLAYRNAETGA